MKAHELLTKEKWIQRAYFEKDAEGNETGRMCLVGALIRAYPDNEEGMKIYKKIEAHLGCNLALSCWNDSPTRKFEEVYAVLKELDV